MPTPSSAGTCMKSTSEANDIRCAAGLAIFILLNFRMFLSLKDVSEGILIMRMVGPSYEHTVLYGANGSWAKLENVPGHP